MGSEMCIRDSTGALLALTGNRTGRSPKDRYIVEESSTKDKIDWGEVNRPFDSNHFDKLWNKVSAYLDDKDHYVSNVHVGSNKDHYIPVEVKSELAWHSLFSKLIFISPNDFNEENKEVWKIITAANYVCDPDEDHTNSESCVIINFLRRKVLIAGRNMLVKLKSLCLQFKIFSFLRKECSQCIVLLTKHLMKEQHYFLDYQEQEKLLCLLTQNVLL